MSRYASEKFIDKSGVELVIRSPEVTEASGLRESFWAITKNSPYILSSFTEVSKMTLEQEEVFIRNHIENENSVLLIAESVGQIIAIAGIAPYKNERRKHRAVIGISMLPEFRGRGLGVKLMNSLIEFTKTRREIKIAELDVMGLNSIAISLYKKIGFKEVCRFPNAYLLEDGRISDNITMTLDL